MFFNISVGTFCTEIDIKVDSLAYQNELFYQHHTMELTGTRYYKLASQKYPSYCTKGSYLKTIGYTNIVDRIMSFEDMIADIARNMSSAYGNRYTYTGLQFEGMYP
jgi:hypothetical protein